MHILWSPATCGLILGVAVVGFTYSTFQCIPLHSKHAGDTCRSSCGRFCMAVPLTHGIMLTPSEDEVVFGLSWA